MSKIDELEKLCLSTLNVTKHDLYLWLVKNSLKTIKSKKAQDILLKLEEILTFSRYSDRTPSELWKDEFPESELFDTDVFDLHVMYYEWMKGEFGYLIDQILHSKDWNEKELATISIFVDKVYPIFVVSDGYKKGQKSTYWYDSVAYKDWKVEQMGKIDFVKKELAKLKGLDNNGNPNSNQ